MREVPRATWIEQPWKNGGGTTLEIVRWRLATDIDRRAMLGSDGRPPWAFEATSDDDYDVRVSLANVTSSGPFSTFAGYTRTTWNVGAAPIHLGSTQLIPGAVIELAGETAIEARVEKRTEVLLLNILIRSSLDLVVGHGIPTRPICFAIDVLTKTAWAAPDAPEPFDKSNCVWIA